MKEKNGKFLFIVLVLLFQPAFCVASSAPAGLETGRAESQKIEISDVRAIPRLVNFTQGQTVTISYRLSQSGKSIVAIYDLAMRLIANLAGKDAAIGEPNRVVWDGRDFAGRLVPDEAYFFTIEARDYRGNTAVYDPTTFSGSEYLNPAVDFEPSEKKLAYELSEDARIRVRAGVSNGPLLITIINWAPRLAGKKYDVWDGKDASGIIDATQLKGYSLLAEAITLPATSILTSGNADYTYFEYRTEIAPDRPKKRAGPVFRNERTLVGSQFEASIRQSLEPRCRMLLPTGIEKNDAGLPIVKGKVPLKIFLDEKIKRYVTEQRYEIIYFVDFTFVVEREEGYSPITWIWDSGEVANGEHILTVNVATLKGQISSTSLRVFVQN